MDVNLAKTFLSIVSNGTFLAAAEKLHLTQTAVSARIRLLEEQLGRRLFVRNRAGARLTSAGERFVRDATAFVQIWEAARQRIALPAGREDIVALGSELNLWNPTLVNWLGWMNQHRPDMALRVMVDTPVQLTTRVIEGSLDIAVLYNPPKRPNLVTELLAEEKLIMVTSDMAGHYFPDSYIHVDWGEEFEVNIHDAFPELRQPSMFVSLGPLALRHLLRIGGSGYFRLGAVRRFLEEERLYRVPGMPEFSHSVHMIHSSERPIAALGSIRDGLRACLSGQEIQI
jgi:DNA-binding transcriptional LysR family regulator